MEELPITLTHLSRFLLFSHMNILMIPLISQTRAIANGINIRIASAEIFIDQH